MVPYNFLGYEMHDSFKIVSESKLMLEPLSFLIFGAHTSILFITKVKISMLIKWSYKSLQLC